MFGMMTKLTVEVEEDVATRVASWLRPMTTDPDHDRCRRLLEGHRGPLVTTAPVVAEPGWLVDRQIGATAEADLYRSIAAGDLDVEPITSVGGSPLPSSSIPTPTLVRWR